jgi:hypothetical protein
MKTGRGVASGAGVLVWAVASICCAQAPAGSRVQVLLSSAGPGPVRVESLAQEEIVREIDDPHSGDRWLLMRNARVPGGPGRLVLVSAGRRGLGGASAQAATQIEDAGLRPVIRVGDRLIVEEHTPLVDAVLEARALNPAAPGSALDVRLTVGGRVLRAVALGPGRAALQPETGARP